LGFALQADEAMLKKAEKKIRVKQAQIEAAKLAKQPDPPVKARPRD
jgi:hypothetical protein